MATISSPSRTPASSAPLFGSTEATVAQRLSRAKAKIRAAGLSPVTPVIVLNNKNATVRFV